MSVLFWGIPLTITACVFHLLIWKIHLPKRQTKVLLLVFFGTYFAGSMVLWGLGYIRAVESLHILVGGCAVTLAYMITYSALEADSPSLVMTMNIASEPDGLPKKRFQHLMTDEVLVIPRVRDLLRDKLAYQDTDGRYRLTSKGRVFARIFIDYRSLMKATQKGG